MKVQNWEFYYVVPWREKGRTLHFDRTAINTGHCKSVRVSGDHPTDLELLRRNRRYLAFTLSFQRNVVTLF